VLDNYCYEIHLSNCRMIHRIVACVRAHAAQFAMQAEMEQIWHYQTSDRHDGILTPCGRLVWRQGPLGLYAALACPPCNGIWGRHVTLPGFWPEPELPHLAQTLLMGMLYGTSVPHQAQHRGMYAMAAGYSYTRH